MSRCLSLTLAIWIKRSAATQQMQVRTKICCEYWKSLRWCKWLFYWQFSFQQTVGSLHTEEHAVLQVCGAESRILKLCFCLENLTAPAFPAVQPCGPKSNDPWMAVPGSPNQNCYAHSHIKYHSQKLSWIAGNAAHAWTTSRMAGVDAKDVSTITVLQNHCLIDRARLIIFLNVTYLASFFNIRRQKKNLYQTGGLLFWLPCMTKSPQRTFQDHPRLEWRRQQLNWYQNIHTIATCAMSPLPLITNFWDETCKNFCEFRW